MPADRRRRRKRARRKITAKPAAAPVAIPATDAFLSCPFPELVAAAAETLGVAILDDEADEVLVAVTKVDSVEGCVVVDRVYDTDLVIVDSVVCPVDRVADVVWPGIIFEVVEVPRACCVRLLMSDSILEATLLGSADSKTDNALVAAAKPSAIAVLDIMRPVTEAPERDAT